jgi:hypothetical protein
LGEEFTFKPAINDMPKDLYVSPRPKLEISKGEQWERLLKPKTEIIEAREKERMEKEIKDV